MTRSQALNQVTLYQAIAAVASVTLTDTTNNNGIAPDIDNALRAIGVSESDLPLYDVPGNKVRAFTAALQMFVLERICAALTPAVDIDVNRNDRISKKRNQLFTNVSSMLQAATQRAAQYGINPSKSITLLRLRVPVKKGSSSEMG